jgi:hypothetical protein
MAIGGNDSLGVSIAGGCPVHPSTAATWITLGSLTNGRLSYTVAPNTTGAFRSSTISIAGKAFMVVQTTDTQPVLYGDLNHDGKVDVTDLLILANGLAGNTQIDKNAADVLRDGVVSISDLITMANFLAGNISNLPVVPNTSMQVLPSNSAMTNTISMVNTQSEPIIDVKRRFRRAGR